MTLSAISACTIDDQGRVLFAQEEHLPQQTASTMKLLAALTAREWVDLDASTEIVAADIPPLWGIELGDVLTYSHVFHATLMQSNNVAARNLGRTAGQLILDSEGGAGDAELRFFAEMAALGDSLGWTGHVVTSAFGGGGDDRLTAWQLCDLMRHVHATDPWLYGVAGTQNFTLHISGARAALVNIAHSVSSQGFPELEAAKSGTGNANQQHVVMGWGFEGRRYYSSIVNSSDRYTDLRAMMDDVIRATTRRRIVAGLI